MDRVKGLISRLDAWITHRRLPRITRRAIFGFLEHDALTYAGSMAYFGVLSLFQLLVLGVVVLSHILGEGAAREFVIEQVVQGTPLDAETVAAVIDSTIEARGTMTIITFGFLLFGALGIFSALANGISLAFENVPRRPFLQHQLVGLLLISLAGLLALASFAIGILTGILQSTTSDIAADAPGRETPAVELQRAFEFVHGGARSGEQHECGHHQQDEQRDLQHGHAAAPPSSHGQRDCPVPTATRAPRGPETRRVTRALRSNAGR